MKKKSTFRKVRKVPILTEEVSSQSDDNFALDKLDPIIPNPRHINHQKEKPFGIAGSNLLSTGQKNNLMTEGDDLISPLGSPGERPLLRGQTRDFVLHTSEENLYTSGNLLGKEKIASQLLVRQSEGDQDVDIENIEDPDGKYVKVLTIREKKRNEKKR